MRPVSKFKVVAAIFAVGVIAYANGGMLASVSFPGIFSEVHLPHFMIFGDCIGCSAPRSLATVLADGAVTAAFALSLVGIAALVYRLIPKAAEPRNLR